MSFRQQGLKEKWNDRSEQFVPVIVKSIRDFTVGTIDFSSVVCTWYCWPRGRGAADPGMDRRLPAGLKARAPRLAAHPTALETCSLRVCSALRKRMASLSCCVSPTPGAWEPSGGEGGIVSRSALSGEANFARLDCTFCFVLFRGVGSPPPPSFTFLHTQLLLLAPAFLFSAGVGREKCVLDFWRRPNNTKQKITCVFWMRPNQTEGRAKRKWQTDTSAYSLKETLSEALLEVTTWIFFFFFFDLHFEILFKRRMWLGGLNHVRGERKLWWPSSQSRGLFAERNWVFLAVLLSFGSTSGWAHQSDASESTGPTRSSPLRILLRSAQAEGVDAPREHLAGKRQENRSGYWQRLLRSSFPNPRCLAPGTTILFKHSWELTGARFLRQGNGTDPKAIKEETSSRMLICPLCNNVTKILMIKVII